jgi:hypothetical protein
LEKNVTPHSRAALSGLYSNNYYKDAACQDFKGSFTVPGCVTASGEGIICFNQGAFGNPLAQSKAQVTLKLQKIQAMVSGEAGKTQDFATTIAKQIGAACEDNGCDPMLKQHL